MTDAAEPAEPIESTEQNEPTEPTDNTEPTEPTERIEPSLAIDRIEPLDTSERSELTLWTVDEPRGAYDGSACGLSHDRKTLVLIEPPAAPAGCCATPQGR